MRKPCKQCNRNVLESLLRQYNGICITCAKQEESTLCITEEKKAYEFAKDNAIILPQSIAEETFFSQCQAYCDIECCGFDAIDISENQFELAIKTIGLETSLEALNNMFKHIDLIGNHQGLVTTMNHYQDAVEAKANYQQVCTCLQSTITKFKTRIIQHNFDTWSVLSDSENIMNSSYDSFTENTIKKSENLLCVMHDSSQLYLDFGYYENQWVVRMVHNNETDNPMNEFKNDKLIDSLSLIDQLLVKYKNYNT